MVSIFYYFCIYLYFQLTPKRPLRSEVEKEKRLSRTHSQIASTTKVDDASVSGESSNSRNSISKFTLNLSKFRKFYHNLLIVSVTTDSQTSEEDSGPPPLPAKINRDSDSFHQVEESMYSCVKKRDESNYQILGQSFVSNSNYEMFEVKSSSDCMTRSQEKKTPPTPPPKPVRTSSRLSHTPKSPLP